jgi:hypothetical protein
MRCTLIGFENSLQKEDWQRSGEEWGECHLASGQGRGLDVSLRKVIRKVKTVSYLLR